MRSQTPCHNRLSSADVNTSPAPSRRQHVLELLQGNRIEEARALCEQVAHAENNPGAWLLLGAIHGMLGNQGDAEDCFRHVIAMQPGDAAAHCNLGIALRMQQRLDEAVRSLRQALGLKPDYPEAHYNLGMAFAAESRLDEAIESFHEAVRLRPDYIDAHFHLAVVLAMVGRSEEAVAGFHNVIHLQPRHPAAYALLGDTLAEQGRFKEAVASYRGALEIRPGDAEVLGNLGNALSVEGEHEEAIVCYRRALELDPKRPMAHYNLGVEYLDRLRFKEALISFHEALALDVDYAEAHFNLGNCLRKLGRMSEAVESFQRAITIKKDYADAHFNLALTHLVTGNFVRGWQEYPWHWQRQGMAPRPFLSSPWDGSDLNGRTVFLHAEQGLGDELFFLRFADNLKKRGAGRLAYRPTPKIASLLTRVPVLDRLAEPEEPPSPDGMIFSVGDLPRLLGMEQAGQIPPVLPLTPLPERLEAARQILARLGPPPYLGVTWRAGTKNTRNALYKEGPASGLAQLLSGFKVTVLILQRLPAPGEIETFSKTLGRPTHDLSHLNNDLETMLALLALLDDYVGVSNTNMHLRAGVGKTARVLVPAPPEWRWMAEGNESPWFPGFRVYRQAYDNNWDRALADLGRDLATALPAR